MSASIQPVEKSAAASGRPIGSPGATSNVLLRHEPFVQTNTSKRTVSLRPGLAAMKNRMVAGIATSVDQSLGLLAIKSWCDSAGFLATFTVSKIGFFR